MSAPWIVLIPLLPLLAFLANGLFGRWLRRAGGWLAVACMTGSTVISFILFLGALAGRLDLPLRLTLWDWMTVGGFSVSIGFHVDQLTCVMLAFIALVSTLVFLYAMGYMAGDSGFNRFFAYMGLFDFSMFVLVLGDSLPVLFIGWEGVGLCSYLLISYYLSMPGAATAGKKAFIVNRIGDFGFLVAMFMLFGALGTLDIQQLLGEAASGANSEAHPFHHGGAFITVVTLMLFLGCTGKSAQIPLFVWLPDAMAGPTPVSALIHAATMVTAGVYLMVRLSALFALAPLTLLVVAVIATLTAFVAGSIALTQRDIKKVLAYSTISQLGYMMLACGVGAYVAGIFHVFTHSFFKGLLFLGAGSVIRATHHRQDMMELGGLRRLMPVTAITFLIACLSITGFPLMAGFFSKDEILWQTFASGRWILYGLALTTALMTAGYAFRAYLLTFEGRSRLPEQARTCVQESPWTMTVPMILLAVGSIFTGFLNLPVPWLKLLGFQGGAGLFSRFLEPIVAPARQIAAAHHAGGHTGHNLALEWGLMGVSVLVALAGILLAWHLYLRTWPAGAERFARIFGPFYKLSASRWWWDDLYNVIFAGGLRLIARISTWCDRWIIDGLIHTVAGVNVGLSHVLRIMQNGQIQAYALAVLIGVNILLFLVWWI